MDSLFVLFCRKLVEVVCRHLPLQDKVVFDNFGGRGLGDDPKYIALELLKRKSRLKLYWILADKRTPLPKGIRPLKLKSLRYVYHVMTCKVIVDNIKHSHHLEKRPDQYYIQTWHATVPLKKTEQEVFNLGQQYIINAVRHSIDTNLMYSNNDFHKYRFEHSFWYRGPVIKCDLPRISVLLNTPLGLKKQVYESMGLNMDKKIVLYAPTFRGDDSVGPIIWNYGKVRRKLEERFDGDFVMLIRLHPNIADKSSSIAYDSNTVNASFYSDMQELLAVTQVLITDYSSSMFDFGITRKPVFLMCKDLKEYASSDRDMEFSMDELPFPACKTEDELLNTIDNFVEKDYKARVDAFFQKIGLSDTGHGAEFVADIIEKRVKNVD